MVRFMCEKNRSWFRVLGEENQDQSFDSCGRVIEGKNVSGPPGHRFQGGKSLGMSRRGQKQGKPLHHSMKTETEGIEKIARVCVAGEKPFRSENQVKMREGLG